jgi:hypothetical protein
MSDRVLIVIIMCLTVIELALVVDWTRHQNPLTMNAITLVLGGIIGLMSGKAISKEGDK